jgi:hypothetical protein
MQRLEVSGAVRHIQYVVRHQRETTKVCNVSNTVQSSVVQYIPMRRLFFSASKWDRSIRSEIYRVTDSYKLSSKYTFAYFGRTHFPCPTVQTLTPQFMRCLGPVSGDKRKSRRLLPPRSPKMTLICGEYRRINCTVIILVLKPIGEHSEHCVESFTSRTWNYDERRD